MTQWDYRNRAREHVNLAKVLLSESGAADKLRYACLELRMAIEALCYDRLEAYLAEVSNDVMKKWTPRQVLEELLSIDPTTDSSGQLWVGLEEQPGVAAKEMKYLGTDERFTVKWANKAHNALGSFLHEETIAQLQAGNDNAQNIRQKAEEITLELEGVLASTVHNVNLGVFCTFNCECGFVIKRKADFLKRGTPAACAACGRLYELTSGPENDQFTYRIAQVDYTCEDCGTKQWVERHRLNEEPVLNCIQCGVKAKVVRGFFLQKLPSKESNANRE